MRTTKVAVTATAKSLFELGNFDDALCNEILLQTPETNSAKVYFGENGKEFAFLFAGGASGLAVTSLKNIYVKGTPPDEIIIVCM